MSWYPEFYYKIWKWKFFKLKHKWKGLRYRCHSRRWFYKYKQKYSHSEWCLKVENILTSLFPTCKFLTAFLHGSSVKKIKNEKIFCWLKKLLWVLVCFLFLSSDRNIATIGDSGYLKRCKIKEEIKDNKVILYHKDAKPKAGHNEKYFKNSSLRSKKWRKKFVNGTIFWEQQHN